MSVKTQGQKRSLHDIMNDMVRAPATLIPQKEISPAAEADAFIALDPLLAGLHKQMLNAQAQLKKLKKSNGKKDAMTAVAADMLDSARSAFETRLIELRRDHFKIRAARRLLRKADEKAAQEQAKTALQYQVRLQAFFDEQNYRYEKEGLRREERERHRWLLFLFWLLQSARPAQASLAVHFTSACLIEEAA
jgi:hypothetical protein